jgi:hypothetical protein
VADHVEDGGPYYPGSEVTMEGTFKVPDANGVLQLTDPTTVTCKVRKPDGTLVNPAPTVTRISLGLYRAKVTPAVGEEGDWQHRMIGTGTAAATKRKMFLVLPEWQ